MDYSHIDKKSVQDSEVILIEQIYSFELYGDGRSHVPQSGVGVRQEANKV